MFVFGSHLTFWLNCVCLQKAHSSFDLELFQHLKQLKPLESLTKSAQNFLS